MVCAKKTGARLDKTPRGYVPYGNVTPLECSKTEGYKDSSASGTEKKAAILGKEQKLYPHPVDKYSLRHFASPSQAVF